MKISAASLTALLVLSGNAMAQQSPPDSIEALWQIIQQQQSRIEQLEAQTAATEAKATANEQKVEATGDYLDTLDSSTSALAAWTERTQLGSYGELHYNNLDADDSAFDEKEIDIHRFVISLNHQFSDRLRLYSEVELEHAVAGDDENGEIELEQAYLEYDLNDQYQLRGGVFLLPIGILNQTHEPTTYYGVERNAVENIIIPTSWWEAGAAVGAHYSSGLSWNFSVSSGLEMDADPTSSSAYVVRSGRQKASEATAEDLAYTAQLKYTGVPGLELATSYFYQNDMSQEANDGLDKGQLISANLIYTRGIFGLRALYAAWHFDGAAVEAVGADEQTGWYVEPALKFRPGNYDIGVYGRYEDVDAYRDQDQFNEWQIGLNYWPVENVVLKADYRDRDYDLDAASGMNFTGFDLGMGYSF